MRYSSTLSKRIPISIIIPIHNVENYLEDTLLSVSKQLFTDIEIICVDDNSTDNSLQILRNFQLHDERIKIIELKKHSSALIARKKGVALSSGEFIMFLDGDDEFTPEAVGKAYNAIKDKKTDMLMFDTEIINYQNKINQERIINCQKFLKPMLQNIKADNSLLEQMFLDHKISFTLWNKIFNGDKCRQAFEKIPNIIFDKANDLFSMVFIASNMKTYSAIQERLIRYKLGSGVTGSEILNEKQFNALLTSADVFKEIFKYLTQSNYPNSELIIQNIKNQLLGECVDKFINHTDNENNAQHFSKLILKWGISDVIKTLAKKFWNQERKVNDKIADYISSSNVSHPIKTIGFYYRSINNGGAQRVTQLLCNRLANLKDENGNYLYKVLCITDVGQSEIDYPLDEQVTRVYVPSKDIFIKERYAERYDVWRTVLSNYNPDIVVSGQWVDPVVYWDLLSLKLSSSCYYSVIAHSFIPTTYLFGNGENFVDRVTTVFSSADGVVCLSKCDEDFAKLYARNVRCINNPLSFNPSDIPDNHLNNNNICWVGRISGEKRPLDLIKVAISLSAKLSTFKLYIVGNGDNNIICEMKQLIAAYNLENFVELCGFTNDVSAYYSQSSLYICTSFYEGFSLSLAEAMSQGLPIISYDMPWLSLFKDQKGITTVPQNDYEALSNRIVELFNNRDLLKKLGNDAKENILSVASANIEQHWIDFFNSVSNNMTPIDKNLSYRIIIDYITLFSRQKKTDEINRIRSSLSKDDIKVFKYCFSTVIFKKGCNNLGLYRTLYIFGLQFFKYRKSDNSENKLLTVLGIPLLKIKKDDHYKKIRLLGIQLYKRNTPDQNHKRIFILGIPIYSRKNKAYTIRK